MMVVVYIVVVMLIVIINFEIVSFNVMFKLSVRLRICFFVKCSYFSLGFCEFFLGGIRMVDSFWNLFSFGK